MTQEEEEEAGDEDEAEMEAFDMAARPPNKSQRL